MRLRTDTDRRDDELLADLGEPVRRAYTEAPNESTAARHLAAIAAVTPDGAAPAVVRAPAAPSRRPAMVRRVAAIAAATLVGGAVASTGLAVAGVELPDPVKAPFDVVGIELPHQTAPASAPDVPATPAVTMPRVPPAVTKAPRQDGRPGRLGGEDRSRRGETPGRDGAPRRKDETKGSRRDRPAEAAPPEIRRRRERDPGARPQTRRRDEIGTRRKSGDAARLRAQRQARERARRQRARRRGRPAPVPPVVAEPTVTDPATAPAPDADPTVTGTSG